MIKSIIFFLIMLCIVMYPSDTLLNNKLNISLNLLTPSSG